HPLAGEDVILSVVAVDGLSQEAETEPVELRLPKRVFTSPLALSLSSARSALASGDFDNIEKTIQRLYALSESPNLANDTTLHLGLRTAYLRLKSAQTEEEFAEIGNLLWDLV